MGAALVPAMSLDLSRRHFAHDDVESLAPSREERAAMLMGRQPQHMACAHFASPKERVYAVKMLTNIA